MWSRIYISEKIYCPYQDWTCWFKTACDSNLRNHTQSRHSVKYACNQCNYYAKKKGDLKIHIKSKHEGVNYSCDQCSHKNVTKGGLKRHVQSKHEGIRYSCYQCDHKTTDKGHLRIHQESKHEGVKYPCNTCDLQFVHQSSLKLHIMLNQGMKVWDMYVINVIIK